MNQSVLILSSDADFAKAVIGRWQGERTVPAFTVISPQTWHASADRVADLAVVGPVANPSELAEIWSQTLRAVEASGVPLLILASTAEVATILKGDLPRATVVRRGEEWLETLQLVGCEMLRRMQVLTRLHDLEKSAKVAERHAVLGRYMLEMRHGMNNALTSVLGNAELLLLEPGAVSAQVREQIETIHTMSLRMHEIIQRFSSLETEMNFVEKESQGETRVWVGKKATAKGF